VSKLKKKLQTRDETNTKEVSLFARPVETVNVCQNILGRTSYWVSWSSGKTRTKIFFLNCPSLYMHTVM